MLTKFDIIAAMDDDSLIGIKQYGKHMLPWPYIKTDLIFYNTIVSVPSTILIVGKNTWETLPISSKKLPSIIVSDTNSFNSALSKAIETSQKIMVIGGATVYDAALQHSALNRIYLTHIKHSFPCNISVEQKIYFPLSHKHFDDLLSSNLLQLEHVTDVQYDNSTNIQCIFKTYRATENFYNYYQSNIQKNFRQICPNNPIDTTNYDEYQYLNLVKTILNNGITKMGRNGLVKSYFGAQLRYNLSEGFPIPTVKKSYLKIIFEELMWMVRGQTDVRILQKKGIHIWDANSNAEYLKKHELKLSEYDIGPGYGFQMRHFGANYYNYESDYTGQGVDQLKKCIKLIKNSPESRRIVINLWNSCDIDKMALPPCHMMYHFTVDGKKLNCHLVQRSWDIMLGWNTTTAALLTYLLAHHCDLDVGILAHSISDAHIYQSHINTGMVTKLCERLPRAPPKLWFRKKYEDIESYTIDDMVLENYYPCPLIKFELVA